jgi:hypothetical protein
MVVYLGPEGKVGQRHSEVARDTREPGITRNNLWNPGPRTLCVYQNEKRISYRPSMRR